MIYLLTVVALSIGIFIGYIAQEKRPPRGLVAAWAVFALPLLFKAWFAVVLS
jgi:hypothetical protein